MGDGTFEGLDLEPLMNPRSIGIVGASQRVSRGTRVLKNLQSIGYEGAIYPINPRYEEIDGLPCYPSAAECPEPIDTLVVAIPGAHVPETLRQARAAGTKSAVVLSSGFREAGEEGLRRHHELEELARDGMPICGPNCYGVLNLASRAAAFSGRIPQQDRVGKLAVISQSGGFSNQIANPLVEDRGVRLKYIVSCGNQVGAKIEDYLDYMVDDPDVEAIGVFAEGLTSAARLIAIGERALERGKTIAMLKGGRSAVGRAGVASHTGSIAGSGDVVSAVLKKAGIVQATSLDELVEVLALVSHGDPRRIGRRVLVVTGSGGENSHAADLAEDAGIQLPPLHPTSIDALNDVLPDFGNPNNPLDGTGAMFEDSAVFPGCIRVAAADPGVDLVAVNLGQRPPEGPFAPMRDFAAAMAALDADARRRVVGYTSTSTGPIDDQIAQPLADAGIPLLIGTATAMHAIAKVAARNERAEALERVERPSSSEARRVSWPDSPADLDVSTMWRLLEEYGLPVVALRHAASENEVATEAAALGFPVVLKLATFDVSHKSDIGGVALNVQDPDAVRSAYKQMVEDVAPHVGVEEAQRVILQPMARPGVELLAGIVRDPALGPAVVVASGGLLVEILDDGLVGIPPLDRHDAERMLRELRGAALLHGVRGGEPADMTAAVDLLLALGRIAADLPDYVQAIDLNPVIVHEAGLGASCVDVWVETRS